MSREKIVYYEVISASYLRKLTSLVNSAIKDGLQPYGTPMYVMIEGGFNQVMVRYEEEKDNDREIS